MRIGSESAARRSWDLPVSFRVSHPVQRFLDGLSMLGELDIRKHIIRIDQMLADINRDRDVAERDRRRQARD